MAQRRRGNGQRYYGNTAEQLRAALLNEQDAVETLEDQKAHIIRLLGDIQDEKESYSTGTLGRWRAFALVLAAAGAALIFTPGAATLFIGLGALFFSFIVGMRFLSERKFYRDKYSNIRKREASYIRKIEDYEAKINEHQAVINAIRKKLDNGEGI